MTPLSRASSSACATSWASSQMKEEIGTVNAKFWQMLPIFLLIVAVAGQLGGWSSYEMVHLAVQLVMVQLAMQVVQQAAQI